MRIGLFIPCYIDQFYPGAAIATLELLEKCGCKVEFLENQICCGQPMANSGFEHESIAIGKNLLRQIDRYDFVVSPSGSCVHHIRHHYDWIEQTQDELTSRNKIVELADFLCDILKIQLPLVSFHHRVGLHHSCHGLRGLRMGVSSELNFPAFNKIERLLLKVEGLELVKLRRVDECCGFGGTFSVKEEAVSVMMGNDRLADHLDSGAEFITSADMSCLMHLEGLIRRQNLPLRVVHFSEILNGSIK